MQRRKRPQRGCLVFAAIGLAGLGLLHPAAALSDETQPRWLFAMNRDGMKVHSVARVEGYHALGSPRWSHDGKRLVFDGRSLQPQANRSFVVGADGSGLAEAAPGALADWSPDDKQLALAAGQNPALKKGIWVQNADGQGRQWLAPGTAPRWSPDGSQIATIAGTLKILDLAEGTDRAVFDPAEKISSISFGYDWSPDGKRLAVAIAREGGQREVVIVDAAGSKQGIRTRLKGPANDVAWSPDGKTLAVSLLDSAGREHRIHLLSADGDDAPAEIPDQQGDNREPAWSPDGAQLAFASSRTDLARPGVAMARGATSLEIVSSYDSGGTCYSLALAPDGRTALLGANMRNRKLQLWDVETGEVQRTFDMLGIFVAISPDGKHAACSQRMKTSVTYFSLEDGSAVRELEAGAMAVFIDFSADGSRLVCGSRNRVALVFDVSTGKQAARLEHEVPVNNGALSPDGTTVATSAGKKLHLWDAASGRKLHEIEHPAMVWGVAFSPDGARVATGTGGTPIGQIAEQRVPVADDNTLRLWDAAEGKLVREMKGHTHSVGAIAFSPDGRRLASGSADGTLRYWDVESGRELARAGGQSWIMKVVFSSDGSRLLTCGGNLREAPEAPRLTDVPEERVRVYKIAVTDKAQDFTSGEGNK
jgi:WD40 repeat protein